VLKVIGFGQSDKGQKRQNNEDNLFYEQEIGFYMVADGMGGHASGEIASKIAVDVISQQVKQCLSTGKVANLGPMNPNWSIRTKYLVQSVYMANQVIFEAASKYPQDYGMGTTVVTVLLHEDNKFTVAHVGDSRLYMVRDGKLSQVTTDHSYVEEQVRRGLLTPEQAKTAENKNILTRALGTEKTVKVDIQELELKENDVYMLCTDGLDRMVPDEDIEKIILEKKEPPVIAKSLIDKANANGGVDNVTVVCMKVEPTKMGWFGKMFR